MKDIEIIREAARIMKRGITNLYVEEEQTKKGIVIFIGSRDDVDYDGQSIHMQFAFDEDGDLLQIG